MKKLYAFYYEMIGQQTPVVVHFLCVDNVGAQEADATLKVNAYEVVKWMMEHPFGKVEYTWV